MRPLRAAIPPLLLGAALTSAATSVISDVITCLLVVIASVLMVAECTRLLRPPAPACPPPDEVERLARLIGVAPEVIDPEFRRPPPRGPAAARDPGLVTPEQMAAALDSSGDLHAWRPGSPESDIRSFDASRERDV